MRIAEAKGTFQPGKPPATGPDAVRRGDPPGPPAARGGADRSRTYGEALVPANEPGPEASASAGVSAKYHRGLRTDEP